MEGSFSDPILLENSDRLADPVQKLLGPTPTLRVKHPRLRASTAQKERDLNISYQILGSSPEPEPTVQASNEVQVHPHFEGKQPKQHKPTKCIDVVCSWKMCDRVGWHPWELEETKEELSERSLIIYVMQGTRYFKLGWQLPSKGLSSWGLLVNA